MSKVSFLSKIESRPSYDNVDLSDNSEHHYLNSGYIKQQIHENKIDEFFWTDVNAPHKRTSPLAVAGAVIGSFLPVFLFAKKAKPDLKFNPFKNFGKMINIEYGLKEILTVGIGGVVGGLAGGLADRKEPKKLEKIEEATFQTMNVTFPALLVTGGIKLCEKTNALNNAPAKIITSLASIVVGAYAAVGISNKIVDKLFDKYNHDPDRKLRKKDFVIHVDDFFGTLILAKFPLADKLQVNKILPFIFAWSGYHVGES